jgi:uncharacterized membrane protein (DUF485 family)
MATTPSPSPLAPTDWQAVERSPEFHELVRARRRFLVPALIAIALFYGGFVVGAAAAPEALSETVAAPFTVGHVWAILQIPFAWIVATLYLRWCTQRVDPLTARIAGVEQGPQAAPGTAPELEVALP